MKIRTFCPIPLTVMALLIFFSACKKEERYDLLKQVPADAAMVIGFNVNNMKGKIDSEVLRSNPIFQELMGNTGAGNAPDFLSNTDETGIDFDQNLYAIMKESQGKKPFLIFEIDDRKQFEGFLKDLLPDEEMQSVEDIQYYNWGQNLVAWKNNIGVMTQQGNGEELILDIFNLPRDAHLQNPSFDEFSAEKFDIGFWVNAAGYSNLSKGKGNNPTNAAGFAETEHFLLINFEQGQLVAEHKMFGEEEFIQKINTVLNSGYDESLLAYLPNNEITGFLSGNLNIEGITDIMEWATLERNMVRAPMEAKKREEIMALLKEMKNHLKGEFIISMHGFGEEDIPAGSGMMSGMPQPRLFAAFTVDDGSSVQAMFESWGGQEESQIIEAEGYYRVVEDTGLFIIPMDDKLFIVSDTSFRGQLLNGAGGTTEISEGTKQLVTGHSLAFYVNINQLIQDIRQSDNELGMVAGILGKFESVEAHHTEMGDDYMANDLIIHFTDKDTNSLETVLNMLGLLIMGMGLPL